MLGVRPVKGGPVPAVIVEEGDTLFSIATEKLGRPAAWWMLATINAISDPRRLRPGDLVALPYGVEP